MSVDAIRIRDSESFTRVSYPKCDRVYLPQRAIAFPYHVCDRVYLFQSAIAPTYRYPHEDQCESRYIAAYLYLLETEPDSFLLAAATQDAL